MSNSLGDQFGFRKKRKMRTDLGTFLDLTNICLNFTGVNCILPLSFLLEALQSIFVLRLKLNKNYIILFFYTYCFIFFRLNYKLYHLMLLKFNLDL